VHQNGSVNHGQPRSTAAKRCPAATASAVRFGAHLATIVDGIHGAPPEQVRPARRLLIFASLATLALNIADPIVTSDYGKAAFDSVGPLLLIGWAGSRPRAATGHRRYQAPAIGGQAC
jgi:hypothetical protein